jgi:hypothetical protein
MEAKDKAKRIWYADIIDLGFNVEECKDNVFERQYGFPYKIITKKLTKNIELCYCQEDGTCEVIRSNKDGDKLGGIAIATIEGVAAFVEFYKKKK